MTMTEADRAGAAGEQPAEDGEPHPDRAPAGQPGRSASQPDAMTEQGAGGGGPAETRDGPEPGDVYVPV
jgi:hypothetical protein